MKTKLMMATISATVTAIGTGRWKRDTVTVTIVRTMSATKTVM